MTNEVRKFKITVSIILAVMVLWTAFISAAFFYHNRSDTIRREGERFGIYVCGIPVQYKNAADVLGDGTVMYDPGANMLTLSNATLEYGGSAAIFAEKDLTIVLEGENRIICTGTESAMGIYVSDYMLRKDVSFMGSGTLSVENIGEGNPVAAGIVADDVWAYSNISIAFSGAAEASAGIECDHLYLMGENTVTVKMDAAGESNGVFVTGNLNLLDNATLDVTNIRDGKNVRGIECIGSFLACKGSTVNSTYGEDGFGILCHSVFFDYGTTVNSEIDAIDGIRVEKD